MEVFDVVVIGAGPGGYPAAIRAAQLGASVAIVEKEQLGGTCLNWGCIPTKALIAGADALARIKHAAVFGIAVDGLKVDYAKLSAHKNKTVETLRGGIKQLLAANGVKQFSGTASFKARGIIAIEGGPSIGARKVIVATGSTSTVPDFLPKHPRVVESRAFLDRKELPSTLIVLGGGFIGCELASMAALLGVRVTLIELLDDILTLLDPDVRRDVRAGMEKELGIRILTGEPLESVAADKRGVLAKIGSEIIEADMLLCAVGRRPVTEGLNLPAAGLSTNERGYLETDEYCRTKAANVFAIGDVTGKVQLAHAATQQGITAAENAITGKLRKHEILVPNVIFTAPQVATVGLSESDAKNNGIGIVTGKFRFAALGKAMAGAESAGFVKWIVNAETDQLLGAAAVGAHATELIATATAAIRAEQTASEFGHTVHAHPTFSEAWMEAVHAVHGSCVHAAPQKRS